MGSRGDSRLSPALKNPVFVASALLFIFNQLAERQGIFIPFIHSYLDDLLCMPVLLTLALAMYRFFLFGRKIINRLSVGQIVFTVVYLAIIFELFLPKYSTKYHADAFDLVAYSAGAVIFYFFINPKKIE